MLKLSNAVRMETPSGRIVVFGVIGSRELDSLEVPEYQREQLPVTTLKELQKAFEDGVVPPLDLGCYGTDVIFRRDGGITIRGEVHLIDGLQRWTAAKIIRDQDGVVWLPVMAYLGTTYEWELERFRTLNADRRGVAKDVLICNMRKTNLAIAALHGLSDDEADTVLSGCIKWSQGSRTGNLLSAVSAVKVVTLLHHHFGGGLRDSNAERLVWALRDLMEVVPHKVFAENVLTFFGVIDRLVKGMQGLENSRNILELRSGYMLSLAAVLGEHQEFWEGNRLVVSDDVVEVIMKLRLNDIEEDVVRRAGQMVPQLTYKLAEKIGKIAGTGRYHRLTAW